MMAGRVASAPLPRAIEYLASLPDYHPTPMEGLLNMDYNDKLFAPSDEQSKRARAGKRGGKPSRPSKFIPGGLFKSQMLIENQEKIFMHLICNLFLKLPMI